MKNKQHEYILKAFLESSIPTVMRRCSHELMAINTRGIYIDSVSAITHTGKHLLLGTKVRLLEYSQPKKGFKNIPDKCRGITTAMLAGTLQIPSVILTKEVTMSRVRLLVRECYTGKRKSGEVFAAVFLSNV